MERDEIKLRDRLKAVLGVYTLEEILEQNDMTDEDLLVFLVYNYGLLLPDYEPIG
jgi:hypothetical protein